MTPAQKRDFIIEVASPFWPAKRAGTLSKIMEAEEDGFLNVNIFRFNKTETSISDCETMEKIQAALAQMCMGVELGILVLHYSYTLDELDLHIEIDPKVELGYGDMTLIVNIILDSLTEQTIRDRFIAYQSEFFERTKTTPADWHMS